MQRPEAYWKKRLSSTVEVPEHDIHIMLKHLTRDELERLAVRTTDDFQSMLLDEIARRDSGVKPAVDLLVEYAAQATARAASAERLIREVHGRLADAPGGDPRD
jgi:hypothetical protein